MNTPIVVNPQPPTSILAVFSLICGLSCWILVPFAGAIAAVICGHIARAEIKRSAPGTLGGGGMAIAGLILGWINLAVCVMAIGAVLLFFGGILWLSSLH